MSDKKHYVNYKNLHVSLPYVDDINVLARKVRVSFPDRPAATFDAGEIRALDASVTPSPAPGTPLPHDGPVPPEEDSEDLVDTDKDVSPSTPQPTAENPEGSGEDTEPEPK